MRVSQPANIGTGPDARAVPCLIPASEIAARVSELGREISADYAGRQPLLIGVLHGAFVFMADLVRNLTIPVRCGFVMVSSYGDEMVTSGRVQLHLDLVQQIEGEDVLLVDDLVDTGLSTAWLIDHLSKQSPASLRVCVLLDKSARRQVPVRTDYVGFSIADQFVVGYGIDWAGQYRELPYIGYVPEPE